MPYTTSAADLPHVDPLIFDTDTAGQVGNIRIEFSHTNRYIGCVRNEPDE